MSKIHIVTEDKILALLLDNKDKKLTIREIARSVNIDYKTVYNKILELNKLGIINIEKAASINWCSINFLNHLNILKAEYIRREKILKNNNLAVLYDRLKEAGIFFILLLFGSYASHKQKKTSDIDLMLLCNDSETKNTVEKVIKSTPLKIHLISFNASEFKTMLAAGGFNVGKETFKNNIILFGIEDYYRLIENDTTRQS